MTTTQWGRILADLRAEDDVDRVVQAARQLNVVATQAHLPELYRLIQDDDWFIREAAAEPLARLEGVQALPLLFRALTRGQHQGQDNDGLSTMIVEVLETHQSECAPLLLAILQDADSTSRENAAWALGWQPAAIALAPLVRAARDCDAGVRAAAAGSLSSFKAAGSVDALLPLLYDSDEQVRVSAAAALGNLGDQYAVPALRSALHDRSERVRSFAQDALERLRNKKSG
jgi:HEAT repeat protein